MQQAPRSPFSLTPWVRNFIIANAIVYLLQITVFTGPWFQEYLAFAPALTLQRPWTIFTYMFLHGGVMHLAFNMLVLFFFGPAVEERMGPVPFARYYIMTGLGGAVLSLLFAMNSRIVGASAAVYGVSLAFAYYWPNVKIFVFPIPVPIKAKWLVGFLAVSSLISGVLGSADGIAHFAHLGGFLFGAAYLMHQRVAPNTHYGSAKPKKRKMQKAKVLVHPLASQKESPRSGNQSERWQDENLNKEVDRVLDKISESGMDSLTPKEKSFLDNMSKQMRTD